MLDTQTQLYWWRVKKILPERYGQLCRVVVRGALNTCLVEFVIDQYRVITSRWYVRKYHGPLLEVTNA